jgi:hypothetical protein
MLFASNTTVPLLADLLQFWSPQSQDQCKAEPRFVTSASLLYKPIQSLRLGSQFVNRTSIFWPISMQSETYSISGTQTVGLGDGLLVGLCVAAVGFVVGFLVGACVVGAEVGSGVIVGELVGAGVG